MSYRVIKTIKGRQYVYEQSTKRVDGRVVTQSCYVGPLIPRNFTGRIPKVNTTTLVRKEVSRIVQGRAFGNFVTGGEVGFFPVAVLPTSAKDIWPELARHELFLSAETKNKIAYKHGEIDALAYQEIQTIIDVGEMFVDEKGQVKIFHRHEERIWRLVVKCTNKGEPMILTYHRSTERQLRTTKKALTKRAF